MNTRLRLLAFLCLPAGVLLAVGAAGGDVVRAADRQGQARIAPTKAGAPANTLAAFGSEKELKDYLKRARQLSPPRTVMPMMAVAAAGVLATHVEEDSSKESITNTQHAGVDEGGIVKLHGQHLVVLRRGRLFTVEVGNGQLKPVSVVNAFGPEMSPEGAWYDELLVSDNKVVVIGYSYQREGTEIGLFDIDGGGRLTYRSTYHLRSNDYYSTRNYASRLVGNKLILYSPLEMPIVEDNRIEGLPGLRKWQGSIARMYPGNARGFMNIAGPASIYRIPGEVPDVPVLHTLTTCDLSAPEFQCKAASVIGNFSEVFYVSPKAVYVWTGHGSREADAAPDTTDGGPAYAPGTLYRMPLDGGTPQAIGVHGNPVDQFSFDETDDGYLNVLIRPDARGDWMGSAQMLRGGEVAMLHVLVSTFGDGTRSASTLAYRRLPTPEPGLFQNRFVQGKLLYGVQPSRQHDDAEDSQLFIVEPISGFTSLLALPHGVDRIEAMGDDAVVVGSREGSLHFSGIRLTGRPTRVQHYVLNNVEQGETRSHGFFYKPAVQGRAEKGSGLLGLPVRSAGQGGTESAAAESAAIVFLRNANDRFEPLGKLASTARAVADDDCKASCVDWYGNARPLFLGGRVLALMGYEIVEGRLDGGAIRETKRVSFSPLASLARVN